MITENQKKTTKGLCPTCQAPNVPNGMHCRNCLCDIFSGEPIGTTKRIILDRRNAARRARLESFRFRSVAELYQTAM